MSKLMTKYTLYVSGEIIMNSNNKAELISYARKSEYPCTVEDLRYKGIIFENKAQRIINNKH